MNRKLSICIVSHNAYGAISGNGGFIGGVERQTSLFAKWLSNRGHRVSIVTWEEGESGDETVDGIEVIKVCRKDRGLPGIKFFYPKWSGLNRALKRADADVYYHNCGDCVTGQIAIWCKANGRPFVFAVASEADCQYPHRGLLTKREQLLFRYGVTHSDRRIVQTVNQQKMMNESFGLDSSHIPMPCEEIDRTLPNRMVGEVDRVLWVGRIWLEKRPQMFLDLAESCPEIEFDLVGQGFSTKEYGHSFSDDIIERAKHIPNLTLHGALQRDQVFLMYDRAKCLCCTSEYEGFPNTFLEAWSRGLPVISTFDPDGIVRSRNLGVYVSDVQEMRAALLDLLNRKGEYAQASRNARAYFSSSHRIETSLPQFERVLVDACSSN